MSLTLPKLATKLNPGTQITLGIRPEHILLKGKKGNSTIDLTVSLSEYLGEETIVYGKLSDGSAIVVKSPQRVNYSDNQLTTISFPTDKLHVFDQGGRAVKKS